MTVIVCAMIILALFAVAATVVAAVLEWIAR